MTNTTCTNCSEFIEPDVDNDWVHAESGVAGCGLPDAEDRELYAEPIAGVVA